MAEPAELARFDQNVAAVNDELDHMIGYWNITRGSQTMQSAIIAFTQTLRDSDPTEDDLYRLVVLAVARLAGE